MRRAHVFVDVITLEKLVSSPDHGNHCDFQQISMILPTFWTLPWYGNLLEVNFQPFGHFHGMEICWKTTSNLLDFHGMEICWKSTSNLLDTSMVWKFVGSQLPTFWTFPWYGSLLEVNFQPFGHFHGMEIYWKSTSNLLDTSMVWKFVGSQLPTFWTFPWYGNLLEVNFQPFGHFHGMEIFGKFVKSKFP